MTDFFLVSPPRAWAEIDLAALRSNLAYVRTKTAGAVMAVVKAGAYGHGLEPISKALEQERISFLGVANVGEARRIREAGVKSPLYLLGATWSEEREEIVARNLTPCISSLQEAEDFNRLAKQGERILEVHIAVDTGMGRGGFLAEELKVVFGKLQSLVNLKIDGIGSHLSSADEDEAFTRQQISQFRSIISELGGPQAFRWRHLSNSAGLLAYDNDTCNLVRPGLMLYGAAPIAEWQKFLEPVMTLKSRVTLLRTLPIGHGVSYGRSFITTGPTRVATVGIGYGDGYPREVSTKKGEVWLRGRRFPILGRITMDQIMVDVTDGAEVKEGDEVELFGRNIPVQELAQKAGIIPWEIFTGITPRVTRLYRER